MGGFTLADLLRDFVFEGPVVAGRLAGRFELDVLKYDPNIGLFIASGKNTFPDGSITTAIIGYMTPILETECDVRFQQAYHIDSPAPASEDIIRPSYIDISGFYEYHGQLLNQDDKVSMEGTYSLIHDFRTPGYSQLEGKWKLEPKPDGVCIVGWEDFPPMHNFLE